MWRNYFNIHIKLKTPEFSLKGIVDFHSQSHKWAFKISWPVQFSSVAQSCPTLCDPMNRSTQASLSIINSRSLPKLMSIELVMPSNHPILCWYLSFIQISKYLVLLSESIFYNTGLTIFISFCFLFLNLSWRWKSLLFSWIFCWKVTVSPWGTVESCSQAPSDILITVIPSSSCFRNHISFIVSPCATRIGQVFKLLIIPCDMVRKGMSISCGSGQCIACPLCHNNNEIRVEEKLLAQSPKLPA